MTYKLSAKTPGIFSFKQFDGLETFLSEKVKEIEASNNSRLIVIETWLVIDWFIRQFIISGINCLDLISDKYDPHYQLLPNSFRECITILEGLIDSQKKLKPRLIDENDCLSGSLELWEYIIEKSPETSQKIRALEIEYQREKLGNPDDFNFIIHEKLFRDKESYRFVSEKWLINISKIDKTWLNKAKKLNNARNLAAHSYDAQNLFKAFGINGKNNNDTLRSECLLLLTTIIGLIEIEESE